MTVKLPALAAALAAAAIALTGCTSDSSDDGDASGAAATTTTMAETTETTMTHGDTAVAIDSGAADLRATLGRLLGEHALLATFATQKGLGGEKDFEEIAAVLDANSVDLSEAIASVYGEKAGKQFLDGDLLWRDHIGFFVDYTTATAKGQKAGQQKAVGNLMGYTEAFSNFLAGATETDQAPFREAITEHVTQLKGQVDAYAGGDYEGAYETLRAAYAHMFMTGDALSGAISEQKPGMFGQGEATKKSSDLRATLGRLLGEHALLAMVATQKGYSGSKDFEQIAAALDANSVDLSEAIASVYGEKAGKQFLDGDLLWRDHIGFFVDYTTALAKGDEPAQQKAVDNLMGYTEAFSNFLATATGGEQAAFREAIAAHVTQLKTQIDRYAAGDYADAWSSAREAYAHMYMTADALATAIVEQSPQKFQP